MRGGYAGSRQRTVSSTIASYAQAARQLGVKTRARMSPILYLLNLSPRVQEGLLLGDLHLSERRVTGLAAAMEW